MRKIIKAVKRPRKVGDRPNPLIIYDICLVERASHRNKVFEKLGSFSLRSGVFSVNAFRLVRLMGHNICLSGRAMQLLEKMNLFPFGFSRFLSFTFSNYN